MCDGGEVLEWVRSQKTKEMAAGYSEASIQIPQVYAATHVTFSRALGINYTNAASFTSVYNYLGNGKAAMNYTPLSITLVNTNLEYKRQNLFGKIEKMKGDYQLNGIGYN